MVPPLKRSDVIHNEHGSTPALSDFLSRFTIESEHKALGITIDIIAKKSVAYYFGICCVAAYKKTQQWFNNLVSRLSTNISTLSVDTMSSNPEHQPTPAPAAEPAGPAAGFTAQPNGSDSESSDEEEGPAGLRTPSTLKDLGDYIWPTFRIQTDH
jgi:hypothetical protein